MKTNFNKSELIANASNFNEIKKITFSHSTSHSFHLLIHIPCNLLRSISYVYDGREQLDAEVSEKEIFRIFDWDKTQIKAK